MKKLIVIDFDGVVRINDKPSEGLFWALDRLRASGYQIVILTARGLPEVAQWLIQYGLGDLRITNRKPAGALAYIDDKGIRFTNWQDIVNYF